MNELITLENSANVIGEIENAFFNIPFENSQFQTEHFVINAQLTPERAYRAIGLRMLNRLRALREAQYGRMREDVDIDELRAKCSLEETSKFDKRRHEIDIMQKLDNRAFTDKLINDALTELNVLYGHFKRLPHFTRVQFESAEANYFDQSLTRQAKGIAGALESLDNMKVDKPALTATEAKALPLNQNLSAFLMMIRTAEGTAGADGYRMMFGGKLFDSFIDHPREAIVFKLNGKPYKSTAAGAYQFLEVTWNECKTVLKLRDFSPESQDAAAAYLINRRHAMGYVLNGNLRTAIELCCKEWASLPGSPYGQPTISMEKAAELFTQFGGVIK